MSTETNQEFFNRADKMISIANDQLDGDTKGGVSASFLYGAARFNAWVSATEFPDGKTMQENRDETIEYFVKEYRQMLTENVDDYIANFAKYTGKGG